MSGRLSERVAIVTGAGRAHGIGAAVAERLCQEGAAVLVTDVLEDEGAATCAELRQRGLNVTFSRLDVTSESEWQQTIERCSAELGEPSILFNNAGVYNPRAVHEETLESWQHTIDVNLTSVFLGMRAVIPIMQRNGGGAIVNTSSMWGAIATEKNAAYHASKAGVTLLSKHAAIAYANDGIRVNALHPGGVQTPMIDETGQANKDAVCARAPLGRLGKPSEIAAVVLFLVSDDAAYVTGAAYLADGGYSAL